MTAEASGQLDIKKDEHGTIGVSWNPIPIIGMGQDGSHQQIIEANGVSFMFSGGGNEDCWITVALPSIEAHEIFYRAVVNRLKEKLKQFSAGMPLVLCINVGHVPTFSNQFFEVAKRRIWPSQSYRRLSALFLFTQRQSFEAETPPTMHSKLTCSLNPNAQNPMLTSFMEAMARFC